MVDLKTTPEERAELRSNDPMPWTVRGRQASAIVMAALDDLDTLLAENAQKERELQTARLRIHEATQKLVAEFGAEGPASLEDMIEKATSTGEIG
jgi:hypothetical protein